MTSPLITADTIPCWVYHSSDVWNSLSSFRNASCDFALSCRLSKGNFGHPGHTHKPQNGLLRTLCGFQKVLRRPVRGFPCTGCTETLFLYCKWGHPEHINLLRTLSGSQKVLRRPVGGFPYTGCTETLSEIGHRHCRCSAIASETHDQALIPSQRWYFAVHPSCACMYTNPISGSLFLCEECCTCTLAVFMGTHWLWNCMVCLNGR